MRVNIEAGHSSSKWRKVGDESCYFALADTLRLLDHFTNNPRAAACFNILPPRYVGTFLRCRRLPAERLPSCCSQTATLQHNSTAKWERNSRFRFKLIRFKILSNWSVLLLQCTIIINQEMCFQIAICRRFH